MKGVVISGTGSGVGKTSITTSLLMRLSEKMTVQPFKVGPDFIDPIYHTMASGRPSRNLDSFMMDESKIKNLVGYASKGSDISVIEGVRGLYEGSSGTDDKGSTAEIAKILGFPVILVEDASSLTRSAAAILNGFRDFDGDLDIAGVIMNNVSGDQHERKLTEAMNKYTDVKVLGMIRKDPTKVLEQRYLGLRTVNSSEKVTLGPLKELTSDIGLDSIAEVAERADGRILDDSIPYETTDGKGLRAAIPKDDAFCFYYHDNIECMKASGIEVTEFSPLAGDGLPDADICYLGGGYPELFAEKISDNKDFIQGLKRMSDDGRRVVGECGGLMAMCSSIVDSSGKRHEMADIFDAEAVMTGKRHGPSYVVAESSDGRRVKGHEYHYSDIYAAKDYAFEYKVTRGTGIDGKRDGMRINRCIGSYMHQHVLSAESWIDSLIGRS